MWASEGTGADLFSRPVALFARPQSSKWPVVPSSRSGPSRASPPAPSPSVSRSSCRSFARAKFWLTGRPRSILSPAAVFTAPIRNDVVAQIHKSVAKNRRQPYSVAENAGHQTSAESWGTGRAVARIPRVGGGGTHRSGQVRLCFVEKLVGGDGELIARSSFLRPRSETCAVVDACSRLPRSGASGTSR